MKDRIQVQWRYRCTLCRGTGLRASERWELWHQRARLEGWPRQDLSLQTLAARPDEPEEPECERCGGTGWETTWTDIGNFLRMARQEDERQSGRAGQGDEEKR